MFDQRTLHGAYFALCAYLFWGVAPVYFKWLDHVPPLEILAHRVVWSLVLLLAILYATGQLASLRVGRKVLLRLAITTALLSANWLIFIYAVINNRIVDTSLGYFINPLINVLLGMVFLGERPRRVQWVAIMIATGGIAIQLWVHGSLPWLALGLAFSFGFYGLMRKNLNLPAATGLALETTIALPFALMAIAWFSVAGSLRFGAIDLQTDALLALGGFVTSFPLLCFAAAVTRLSLIAVGMFQYLAPTLSLMLAVLVYDEPFTPDRMVTFACIWIALAIFTLEAYVVQRRLQRRDQLP